VAGVDVVVGVLAGPCLDDLQGCRDTGESLGDLLEPEVRAEALKRWSRTAT
jgi:hypothetical protein